MSVLQQLQAQWAMQAAAQAQAAAERRPRVDVDLPDDLSERWHAAVGFFDGLQDQWKEAGERAYWDSRNSADDLLARGGITKEVHRARLRAAAEAHTRHQQAVAQRTADYPSPGGRAEHASAVEQAKEAAVAAARPIWEALLADLEARMVAEEERLDKERAAARAREEAAEREERRRTATEARRRVEAARRAAEEAQAALRAAEREAAEDDAERAEIEAAVARVKAKRQRTGRQETADYAEPTHTRRRRRG